MKEFYFFLTFYTPFKTNLPVSVPRQDSQPDYNKITTILNFLSQDFDTVHFIGGDPTILPIFNDVLDFAVERYRKIYIETPGAGPLLRVGYNIRQHLNDGADIEVRIPMLDMDPSIFDKYVGDGAWETALGAATLLDATLDIHPKIILYVGAHSTHRYQLLANLDFNLIVRRAYGMKVTPRSVAMMYELNKYEEVEVDDYVIEAINGGQPAVFPRYVLDYDGNIYLSRYYVSESTKIGNIFGLTLDDFYNTVNAAFKPLQDAPLKGKCSRCAYAEICMGGDFHFWPSTSEAYDQVCPISEEAVVDVQPSLDEEEEQEQTEPQTSIDETTGAEEGDYEYGGEDFDADDFIETLDE